MQANEQMWTTEIRAIDPIDGELKLWQGPNVPGKDFNEADRYCIENGLGYCVVTGRFVAEIGWDSALFATKLENPN